MRLLHSALLFAIAVNGNASAQVHNVDSLREIAKSFLSQSAAEFGEAASVEVGNIDTRLKLNHCDNPTAFLPSGSKAWGKITVGIKCTSPQPWQIYVSAQVRVKGDYYVAATNLNNGQVVGITDLVKVTGDLSSLPANAVTNPQQIVGKTLQGSYSSGIALRMDMFRSIPVVQQGQTVKVISYGKGFSVSTEATALNNASEGQVTKVKTNNGQLIAGIAKLGGIIEIQN